MVIKSIILQELLASLGVQMVMVSFGSQKGAARWKRETGCTHTVVTDQSRKVNLSAFFFVYQYHPSIGTRRNF